MKDDLAKFDTLARQRGWHLPEHDMVLDLGCGVGTATGLLTKKFNRVFAVNPAWDEMVIAERVNREWFGGRMTLLRALGECLPFRDETFDLVCALDVMEHVLEPMKVLREVERVLKPGGLFIFNSPNQYNIVSADGHVQVRFVGFIPSNMRESYVCWRTGGFSWEMRNVHPLSYWKLNHYMKRLRHCDFHFRTFVPVDKESDWKGLKGKLVCSVPGMRFLVNRFFRAFGSVHDVVVKKNDHSPNYS
ncbi:class I SAM-dependent methyltransferase [Planctomycetota bacterium]